MQKIIMHIDMNSYFASCEQQDNLAWRGKPLGVCEHLGGIIIAPSIEAKRWGIKTGTPVWEARKLYPQIILTKTTPARYRYYTARFLKVFADYTDYMEKYSIDEAFLDVSKIVNLKFGNDKKIDPYTNARKIALEIKQRMKSEVGDYLTCSVGIGWNKLIAKIGSDMQKPDGLVVLKPADKDMLYKKLKLTDVPGIARRTERNLYELGIKSLLDLKNYPASKLVARFGIMGYHLYRIGQLEGSWKEGFNDEEPIKSIGHMYTLEQEFRNTNVFMPVLYKLCEMVAARLRVNGLMGDVVSVYVRQTEGDSMGQSKKLKYFLTDGRDIFLESKKLLQSCGAENLRVKLIGITVSGLTEFTNQRSLFPAEEKRKRAVKALDKINDKYGDFTISRVPSHLARHIIRDSVGFGRMKEFTKSYLGRKQ